MCYPIMSLGLGATCSWPRSDKVTLLVQGNNVNAHYPFTSVQLIAYFNTVECVLQILQCSLPQQLISPWMATWWHQGGIQVPALVGMSPMWAPGCRGQAWRSCVMGWVLLWYYWFTDNSRMSDYSLHHVFDFWLNFNSHQDQKQICMITLSQVESHYL